MDSKEIKLKGNLLLRYIHVAYDGVSDPQYITRAIEVSVPKTEFPKGWSAVGIEWIGEDDNVDND